jgi:hypothetical protein
MHHPQLFTARGDAIIAVSREKRGFLLTEQFFNLLDGDTRVAQNPARFQQPTLDEPLDAFDTAFKHFSCPFHGYCPRILSGNRGCQEFGRHITSPFLTVERPCENGTARTQ